VPSRKTVGEAMFAGLLKSFCISLTDEAIHGSIRFIANDVVRTPLIWTLVSAPNYVLHLKNEPSC
jgi:hypothetical protein